MFKKTELPSTINAFEDKYQKFWLASDTPLNNACRILNNYCRRALLEWAPSVFQRLGKVRNTKQIAIVDNILTTSMPKTVEELISLINSQVKTYAPDSSLLKRMQFICDKINLSYSVKLTKTGALVFSVTPKAEALDIKQSGSLNSNYSVCSPSIIITTTTEANLCPQMQLLESYKKYNLLEEFNDPEIIAREDNNFKNVIIESNLNKLSLGTSYLYVITPTGEIWFAPQHNGLTKLTHAGLIRKAMKIAINEPTPPVIVAGTFTCFKEKKVENKPQDTLAFATLGSGHFEPNLPAYIALSEILIDKLEGRILYLQHGYAHTHFKSLDLAHCHEVSLVNISKCRSFKLDLLSCMNNSQHEKKKLVMKIFHEINEAGKDNSDEDHASHYSHSELESFFQDSELSAFFDKYNDFFPEDFQIYRPSTTLVI